MSTTVHIPNRAGAVPNSLETVAVYLRAHWTDAWALEPFLFCNHASWTAAPNVASAEFEWRYGTGMRQGEVAFGTVPYRHLTRYFVKVEVQQFEKDGFPTDSPLIWVGIVEEDGDNVLGSLGGNPHGIQKILAYGLESLLDQCTVNRTYYTYLDALKRCYAAEPFDKYLKISNQPADKLAKKAYHNRVGNRSEEPGPDGVYVFAGPDDFEDGRSKQWSAEDICAYLLEYFDPRDKSGMKVIPFELSDGGETVYLPTGGVQEVKAQLRTVRDILNEVIDRRRLLGYTVEMNATGDKVFIRPFTFLDVDIEMPDEGLALVTNADEISLVVDDAAAVEQLHVRESSLHSYDRVVAVGAPILVCATFSKTSSLEKMWTATEETDFATAATGEAGYAALEEFIKIQHNETARSAEKFDRVYTTFGLSRAETVFYSGDPFGGTPIDNLETLIVYYLDLTSYDGSTDTELFHPPSLRLSPRLPLRSDHDYRDDKIAADAIVDNSMAGGDWNYLYPLVVIDIRDPDRTVSYFSDVTKTGELAAVELADGLGPGLEFSCSVHIPEDANYFKLQVDGTHRLFLAKNRYTPPGTLGYEEEEPLYDWEADLLATLAIVCPPVYVAWPETITADPECLRTLFIDASDYAALHYVAPKTVVAVENGALVRTNAGGLIRDDRDFLTRIARLAFEWYGTFRQAITLSYRGATPVCRVGDLIVELGVGATLEEIRTVVTEIRIDFAQSAGDTHRTTIQTQWAELDVLRMIL